MAVGLTNGGDEADEVKGREGSIVKIVMKDFITYDSVECTPGSSLNVVIGPNGTGKSTILSAIVLGLGGKPSLLGKPNTPVQEFIKTHRNEAIIEIELLRQRKNTVIRRKIMKDGKSLWYINGAQKSLKDVEAETKSLNIQIDNLCQVLAQDRVQDFAKLNKQELLEATQKAVGKEGMSEIHSNLKDLRKDQKLLETQIESEEKRCEMEEGQVDRLKGAVEKLERRRGIEEEAEACRIKLSVVLYKLKRDEVDRYKAMKKEADEKVKSKEANLEPFKQGISEAESKYNLKKNKQSGMERKTKIQEKEVSAARSQLENLRDDILDLEVTLERRLKMVDAQKGEEDKVRQAISKLRNDIASQESISPSEQAQKIRQLNEEVSKLAASLNAAESKKLKLDHDIRDLRNDLSNVERDINRVGNLRAKRMRTLQEAHNHAYQAAQWVDQNRHQFENQVYLPMIVELDVNPQFAKYVENAVGFSDLIAIVCESKNDMKVVVENCRKRMGLSVNVMQADAQCRPAVPRVNFNNLKRQCPKFDGYLSEFVKGPPVLLNFLNHKKDFHNIPVALQDMDTTTVPQEVTKYYIGDTRRGVVKSRYGPNLMYTNDPIYDARFFKSEANEVDVETLNHKAASLNLRIDQKEGEKKLNDQEIAQIRQERNKKREEQQNIQQIKATVDNMKFKLGQKERELSNLERNRVNPEKDKEEFSIKIKEAVKNLANAQETFFKTLKQLDAYFLESQLLELEVQAAKSVVSSKKRLCKAEQDAHEEAKREAEEIGNTLAEMKTEAAAQVRKIEQKYKKKVQALWNEYEAAFSTLPNSVEELETHIEDKMARAEMLGGGNDADVIRQYEGHVRQLESLRTSIAEKKVRAAELINNMEARENAWKAELDELVNTISNNFSRYFREMKCAGAVELFTGNNEHDYDNYGLRVRVKYRESEDLQDLNAFTQSGGERAVATAIYMLALQELTPAPFRLVDEINQGMDSLNERRVYELLLQSTSRPNTPQYFLLTPKLLKDMKYNRKTTVLCVMNSACAPNHKTWDINKFISIRKNLRLDGRGQYISVSNGQNGDDSD